MGRRAQLTVICIAALAPAPAALAAAGPPTGESASYAVVDFVRAAGLAPEAKELRRQVRERREELQGRADGLRERLARTDPQSVDYELDRQALNRSIARMEEQLASYQDEMMVPVVQRLESRLARLRGAGWSVVEGQADGLPSACDLTRWLAQSGGAPPAPKAVCRRRGLVVVRPDVAYASTAEAAAATERLNRLKARLESELRAGPSTEEAARQAQGRLTKAEREAQAAADEATEALLEAWRGLHPHHVLLELTADQPAPEGSCDATPAFARDLAAAPTAPAGAGECVRGPGA